MSLKHEERERERVMGIYLFSVDNTLVCSIALCVKKWIFFLHHIRLWWNCRANVESGHKVISFTIFKFTWSLQFPNLKICCSITGTNIFIIWLQQVLGQWFWNPHYILYEDWLWIVRPFRVPNFKSECLKLSNTGKNFFFSTLKLEKKNRSSSNKMIVGCMTISTYFVK